VLEAASEVEERRDERVRNPRVAYAAVPVDVDGDEGLVMVLGRDNRSRSCRAQTCPAWDERVERERRERMTHDDLHL
jgi:hypothetical protein